MFGRADAEDALRTACVRAGLSDLDRRLDRWATWAQIALRIPAIRFGTPRYRRSAKPDPFKRQAAQIVQSCKTLDDFLPGFWLPPVRWSDIDTERRTIRWRGEHEKTGYEHRTPVTAEALAVLEEARMHNPGIGDSPVLPAPKDPQKCPDRSRVRVWWDKAQTLAGLDPKRGRGWHSLRRKFASDLMNQPLKVLCELGGWKTPHTVLQCYQKADQERLRQALEDRGRARS